MTELSLLLPKALRQLPPTDELAERLVISVWERVVGETLAQRTKPFRLYKSTLVVSVPSLMWKRELHHLQEEILERLRKAVGQKIVHALEFRVDVEFDSQAEAASPACPADPREPVSLSLDCIEDLELRRGFAAAASSYLNRPR
jgi:predicted nucleic acid-binding Zn ribbon protein